jgi:hypothetical protein
MRSARAEQVREAEIMRERLRAMRRTPDVAQQH